MQMYINENICLCENDARTVLQQYFLFLSMWIIDDKKGGQQFIGGIEPLGTNETSILLQLALFYISESIYMCISTIHVLIELTF